jgi:hypothetical protein
VSRKSSLSLDALDQQETSSSLTPVHVLVGSFGSKELFSFTDRGGLTFTDSVTHTTVSISGIAHQARNPGSLVYINNVNIGEIGGSGLASGSFSPDHKYFAFLGWGIWGGGTMFDMYAVDLSNKEINQVAPPRKETDFQKVESDLGFLPNPYIESFAWDGNGFNLTFFFVEDNGTDIYRISPREVWHYDLRDKKYNLLDTLPESNE